MILVKQVTDYRELEGIKQLQNENLRKNVSEQEAGAEGFVTAEYTLDFLKTMHNAAPSIIAKAGDRVVGYALVSIPSVRSHHGLLADLFDSIDKSVYKNQELKNAKYVVVGQLCVSKPYRGLGLVQQMYHHFRDCFRQEYDYCITDVAKENARSLKAHMKTGFRVVNTLSYGGMSWDLVLWDWNDHGD